MALCEVLLILLSISAHSSDCSEILYVAVNEGEAAVLSCGSVMSPQCEMEWYFLEESSSTLLFSGEKRGTSGRSGTLLQNCSLLLNNVTQEEAGFYSCSSTDQQGAYTDTVLSVITVAEQREGAVWTLTCSVTTVVFYRPGLTWLNEGEEVPDDHRELSVSRSNSTVSVSFSSHRASAFHQTLRCQISDGDRRQERASALSAWPFRDFLLRHAVVSAGMAALLLCVGALLIWGSVRENKTKRNSRRTRLSARYMDHDHTGNIYAVIEV